MGFRIQSISDFGFRIWDLQDVLPDWKLRAVRKSQPNVQNPKSEIPIPKLRYTFMFTIFLMHTAPSTCKTAAPAIILRPNAAELHCSLGNALHSQGQTDAALRCYQEALAFAPNFAEAHNSLGTALQDQGKLDESIASYRNAVALNAGLEVAHCNLGGALFMQGEFYAAVDGAFNGVVALRGPGKPRRTFWAKESSLG